jgi:hypothetical protein
VTFASSGVKWSELLRLPYFDPTRFVVIDAMHNLFLGLINEHFQNTLGIRLDKDKEPSDSTINVDFTDPHELGSRALPERKVTMRLIDYARGMLEVFVFERAKAWREVTKRVKEESKAFF